MSVRFFLRVIARTAIIVLLVFSVFCSVAMAGCNWNMKILCYTGQDSHGATIDNPSPPYDLTDRSYKILWIMPGWFCSPATGYWPPPNCCLAYEYVYEWQPDPNNACCDSPDSCCGSNDPCCGSIDPCCGSDDYACCSNPSSCTCHE